MCLEPQTKWCIVFNPAMDCTVQHNAFESSENIDLMSNLLETSFSDLPYKDDAILLIKKHWLGVMIFHMVCTMLEQSPWWNYMLKLCTHNWPKFVCFYRGNFSQIVAFEIIFCRVIWTGGLVWWTTSWWLNGQLIYSCTIPPYSYPTKQHLITETHIDSTVIDYSFELE